MARNRHLKTWVLTGVVVLVAAALTTFLIWRKDILQALLNPQLPYAVYRPPPAPAYDNPAAWALLPGPVKATDGPADVFFIHPTTFDGGRDWNGPVGDATSARRLARVILPNYAGPFAAAGRVFAPRYRQASLYTSLTLFDDAIEAREFAYGDVRAAFASFLRRSPRDRPIVLVGVEQGGVLAARLLRETISADPSLRGRLAAAYFVETAVPADEYGPGSASPACASPTSTDCVVAWISAPWLDFGRARRIMNRSVVWNDRDHLVGLDDRAPLCVNPLLGAESLDDAPARWNRGAASATGLEWGARPGFLARQVGARCVDGILRVTRPRSASLRPSGGWIERLRVAPYNLFWADLEADAQTRVAARVAGRQVKP